MAPDGDSPDDPPSTSASDSSPDDSERRVPDLVVRGLTETEIFDRAPVLECDRVHWDTVEPFDPHALLPDLREQTGQPAWTRQWSDGQCRVWIPAGTGHEARELIRSWCEAHDVDAVNMRVEAGVPFRDLSLIDSDLLAELFQAAVQWLYPRMSQVRRKLVADLDLVDDDDVLSMMYLFVSDLADRYDSRRTGRLGTVNFLAYLIGKMKTWPQDLARTAYGRTTVADRIAMSRAVDAFLANEGRSPNEVELADSLGITVTELRRREAAIATLSSFRNYDSLTRGDDDAPGFDAAQVAADADTEGEALDYARAAAMTRAVMAAVHNPEATGKRAQDPLALAALYLTFYEGMGRPDVARELDVLPKTITAATSRALDQIDPAEFR